MFEFLSKELKNGSWKCLYCGKTHSDREGVFSCLSDHELILLPLSRDDLHRLYTYVRRGNQDILSESLVKILGKYHRKSQEFGQN